MKKWLSIFMAMILMAGSASAAQKLSALETLNLLAYGGVGQMRYKIGGEPGGERPELDDASWDVAAVGFKWDLPNTNVWFRARIDVSDKIGGFSLVGRDVKLYIAMDNGGIVYVNGDSIGAFDWWKGQFEIASKLRPGQSLAIAILGINRPGYGQLLDARIEFSGMVEFQRELQKRVWRLFTAKRLANMLSDRPDYWCEEADQVAERVVKTRPFFDGNESAFLAAFDQELEALRPLGDEMRAKYHVYAAGYAHIDLAWLWSWRETIDVTRATTESVFNIMDRFPDFKYTMGQAHAYKWLEIYYPELIKKVQQKIAEGRWEVMGGMWVEPDCNLPSGESFVRQVLYGKRYFQDKLGVDVKVCWIPDSFGFNWNLPQILARSGFEAFVTHKINWNDTNKFPYRFFWWEAPDGSRIMSYIPRSGYGHDLNGNDLIEFVQQERDELGFGKDLVLYGVGNHGGGPTMQMLERAEKAIYSPAYVDVKLTTSKEFFDTITPAEKEQLPVWDNELYLEYHRGTYTSQALTKQFNRKIESLAITAEKLALLAGAVGEVYPEKDFHLIWETLLFNQFHDILPGSSINQVYHDTRIEYTRAQNLGADIAAHSLDVLSRKMDTRGPGEALVVFNPSSWQRTSIARLPLGRLEATRKWSIQSEEGRVIPSQIVDRTPLGARLIFLAADVPSLGYRLFRLVEGSADAGASKLAAQANSLSNEILSLKVDPQTGLISELTDVAQQRQILAEPRGNVLQMRQVQNLRDDAWNLRYVGEWIDLDSATVVELVETGPVRATIHVKHDFLGPQKMQRSPTENFPSSFFDQYISLYAGLPYVEVRNHFEWWEENKMLKVAFPVNVSADRATYEIPYASISRSTRNETSVEKAMFEMPAQRWADLSDGDYGVSLINESKYGYDIKGNLMRLSLLRAPLAPDPMCDRGYHDFSYALYPHKGDWRQAQTTRRGIEYNEPLMVHRAAAHKGNLPKSHSWIQIEPENVVLNVLKKSEDDNDWLIRCYETAGQSTEVALAFPGKLSQAVEVDLIEKNAKALDFGGTQFRFKMNPYEIRSFKVAIK